MKTDLTKILAISGQRGLFNYISNARNGAVVESLIDKKRSCFGVTSKITTLADISIYVVDPESEDDEIKLKDVFLKMKDVLADAEAPSSKASAEELKAFFEKAIPTYDHERFYVSHMKKVCDWYNCLLKYASFDFVEEEEPAAE